MPGARCFSDGRIRLPLAFLTSAQVQLAGCRRLLPSLPPKGKANEAALPSPSCLLAPLLLWLGSTSGWVGGGHLGGGAVPLRRCPAEGGVAPSRRGRWCPGVLPFPGRGGKGVVPGFCSGQTSWEPKRRFGSARLPAEAGLRAGRTRVGAGWRRVAGVTGGLYPAR